MVQSFIHVMFSFVYISLKDNIFIHCRITDYILDVIVQGHCDLSLVRNIFQEYIKGFLSNLPPDYTWIWVWTDSIVDVGGATVHIARSHWLCTAL